MEIKERLQNVFRDVFDDENLIIEEKTTAKDIEDWDSLSHVQLVVAVEREFKIKLGTAEVMGLKNVGEMLALVAKKLS